MKMQRSKMIYLISAFSLLMFSYQNCSKGFKTAEFASESKFGGPDDNGGSGGSASPTPTPVPEITDWNGKIPAGVLVNNCMNDARFNFCVIYKDPVTANNETAFAPRLTPTTSTDAIESKIINYGLRVPANFALKNNHFEIIAPTTLASPNAKGWKFSYKNDTNHFLGQIQLFYWLNRQVSYMQDTTGAFYYKGKQAPVEVFDTALYPQPDGTTKESAKDNAFFDGVGVSMGRITRSRFVADPGPGDGDVALDAAVIAHEVGHGNLRYAMNTFGGRGNCPNKDGCLGGIHEGMGDIHSLILFPNNSRLGSFYYNGSAGLRDASKPVKDGTTSQTFFARRNGEVHDMGEVYAAIWFEVWNKYKNMSPAQNQKIERLFSSHLAALQTTDNFTSALRKIETIINQNFASESAQMKQAFRDVYAALEVTTPP